MTFHLFKKNVHTFVLLDNDCMPTVGGSDMSIQHLSLRVNQLAKVEGRVTVVVYDNSLTRLGNWEVKTILNVTPTKPFDTTVL